MRAILVVWKGLLTRELTTIVRKNHKLRCFIHEGICKMLDIHQMRIVVSYSCKVVLNHTFFLLIDTT